MVRKAPLTPDEVLGKKLANRPKGTECALVLDPDRLIDWDRPSYEDSSGRTWHRLLYAGDDIAFRFGLRRAVAQDGPRLIVVTRAEGQPDEKIELTYLADVLATVEGDPIDLSLVAYFKWLFPKVSPPVDELRHHKDAFVASVPGLVASYDQFKMRWGEPDNWDRRQLLAILLMANYPSLRLEDVLCEETEPADFLGHAIRLIVRPDIRPEDAERVRKIIHESSRIGDLTFADPWLDMDAAELASYLVMREFLGSHDLQHPGTLLAGKVTFSVDLNLLEDQTPSVIARLLSDQETWSRVNRLAESYLSARKVAQVIQLVESRPENLAALTKNPATSPLVLRETLAGVLRAVFAGLKPSDTSWVASLRDHPFSKAAEESPVAAQAACLSECLVNIIRVEDAITKPIPSLLSAEELLTWYTGQGVHLLELSLSQSFARLEAADDQDLLQAGEGYLLAGSNSLKTRLREYLDQVDETLADFIRPDPRKFMHGRCSTVRLLKDKLYKNRRTYDRIWILLFDGMRFDTWDAIVWPILSEHFELVDEDTTPRFAVPPSKTDIARRSLFAGAVADGWKNYYGKWTKDERILASRALGVPKGEVDTEVRFIREAETEEARRKMGFSDADARDLNILIYPISDDLGHYHSDTLASLNEKIRQQMMTQQGVRGILDDLRSRIGKNDLVLITSDHGFIEMPSYRKVEFNAVEAHKAGTTIEEAVAYRYLKNFKLPKGKDIGPHVTMTWEEPGQRGKTTTEFTLPVGSVWYHRAGKPARYHHGGVSMAEMVVPGVLLKPITQKQARIELLNVPEQLEVAEDEPAKVSLRVRNSGNVDADYELTGTTNLNEMIVTQRARLGIGKVTDVDVEFTPRYATDANRQIVPDRTTRMIVLRMKHTRLNGTLVEMPHGKSVIRVNVKPKATKLISDEMFKGLPT